MTDKTPTELPHPPLCVITNQPARYRDPKTGLPYHNTYAFKEIQKLTKGNFKWSKLLGTWVGNGSDAAQGVPDRFARPETEEERKERLERKEQDMKVTEEQRKAADAAEAAKTSGLKTEEPAFAPMPDVDDTKLNTAPLPALTPAAVAPNILHPMPAGVPAMAPAMVPAMVPAPGDGKPAMRSSAPVATMGGQPGQSS